MAITPMALEFLSENRFRDSKQWYEEHKPDYKKYVVEPLADMVCSLTPTIQSIDTSLLCIPRVGGSISRVRRDTRFTKDKTLYRDTAWIVFIRDKKLYDGLPGFFFEFSPRGFRYGCGYYTTGASSLEALRRLILAGDISFTEAKAAVEAQSVFNFEGEMYKRSRFPEQSPDMRLWLDRRNFDFIRSSEELALLFSPGLTDMLAEDFLLLAPVYRFLMKAEGSKQRSDRGGGGFENG